MLFQIGGRNKTGDNVWVKVQVIRQLNADLAVHSVHIYIKIAHIIL